MSSYWAVLSAQFRALLQYRAAALAGLGTQVFWGLIRVMIFQAFFRSTTAEQPMKLSDVLTYVWLGQAFLALLPWNQDNDLRTLIRTGGVGYELLRPVDLYGFWYCRSLAFRTAPTLLRAIPLIAFAGVFMGMDAPETWTAAGAFAASMIGAILMSSAITTLFSITMMWTISGDGVFALADAMSRGFDTFGTMVKSGDFDRLLTRPRSTALQLAGQELTLRRVGRLAQGLIVLVWASFELELDWSVVKFGVLLATVAGGACLFVGLIVLQATLAFWTTETLEIMNTVTYGGVETTQYPISIYRPWFRRFFTFGVPLACVSYFPSLAIMGVQDPLGSPVWFQYACPLIGVGFLVVALQVWKFGVRHYLSTGS